MGTTYEVKETDLVDIENYCNELSTISGLSVPAVRVVVLNNFASVYSNKVSFTDATSNIVKEISAMIQVKSSCRPLNRSTVKKQVLVN